MGQTIAFLVCLLSRAPSPVPIMPVLHPSTPRAYGPLAGQACPAEAFSEGGATARPAASAQDAPFAVVQTVS